MWAKEIINAIEYVNDSFGVGPMFWSGCDTRSTQDRCPLLKLCSINNSIYLRYNDSIYISHCGVVKYTCVVTVSMSESSYCPFLIYKSEINSLYTRIYSNVGIKLWYYQAYGLNGSVSHTSECHKWMSKVGTLVLFQLHNIQRHLIKLSSTVNLQQTTMQSHCRVVCHLIEFVILFF